VNYKIDLKKVAKKKWNSIPDIHYFYNVSTPINFNVSKGKIELSAEQMQELKKNDLLSKLLSLKEEKSEHTLMIILIIVFGALNFIMLLLIGLKLHVFSKGG
jgi:hypothetical protein